MTIRNTFLALAVIACTSANGAVMYELVENAAPEGFYSVTVKLLATDGDTVGGVQDLLVTGAHQIYASNGVSAATQTPERGDGSPFAGTFGNDEWAAYDTHVLPLPATNKSPGYALQETNDGTNPGGRDWKPSNPAFQTGFDGMAGIGALANAAATDTVAFLAPQPTEVDFLQVVIPEDGLAEVSFMLGDQTGALSPVSFQVAIPEPATAGLLGLSLAGVFGFIRRR